MLFVSKNNPGDLLKISSDEASILYGKTDPSNPKNIAFITRLLECKEDYWIACGCSKEALLVICLLQGKIYVRCKEIELHNANCFFRKNKACVSQDDDGLFSSVKKVKKYNIYKNALDVSKNNISHEETSQTSRSLSRLGQVLYTIFEDAGLNIIDLGRPMPLLEQLSAITKSFQDPQKLISKNIPLGRYYRYSISHDSIERTASFLQKAQSWFPSSIKPFVLFSAIATDVATNTFTVRKYLTKPFTVKNNISLPSNRIGLKKSAPYFILASALLDNNTKVILHEAFAMPVLSTGSLMPIESDYERTVLKIILSVCKNNKQIKIEKPLFDLIEDKLRFRPDFIIHCEQGRKIFVEVLGSNHPQYLHHKNNIATHTRRYCHDYISVQAFALNKEYDSFVQKIKFAININNAAC